MASLQEHPEDRNLREKIIKTASAMKPSLSVPVEADELMGWAAAAFKNAKTAEDYRASAQAYQKALVLAPWLPEGYRALALAQEKAGEYAEAANSLRYYLLAIKDAPDVREIRQHIGTLRYEAEKGPVKDGQAQESKDSLRFADMVKRFKELGSGRYSSTFECDPRGPIAAIRKRKRMECNEEEYRNDHWHEIQTSDAHEFRFPKDGSIQFWSIRLLANILELEGKSRGPAFKDIEWSRCDRREICSTPVWVYIEDDLHAVTFSADRPIDDAAFDPHANYSYVQYRRK